MPNPRSQGISSSGLEFSIIEIFANYLNFYTYKDLLYTFTAERIIQPLAAILKPKLCRKKIKEN